MILSEAALLCLDLFIKISSHMMKTSGMHYSYHVEYHLITVHEFHTDQDVINIPFNNSTLFAVRFKLN